MSSSLPLYASFRFCWSNENDASVLYDRLKFNLSPTLPFTLTCIFSSKSKMLLFLDRSVRLGFSMYWCLKPKSNSADPCIFSCTPPGPNTLSAGPMLNFMSVMSNFFSLLCSTSPIFCCQYWCIACCSLYDAYSCGVIRYGVAISTSPIFV